MNEYKRYDSDLKPTEKQHREPVNSGPSPASSVITSVLLSVIVTVTVCSALLFAVFNKLLIHAADSIVLRDSDRGNAPLTEEKETPTFITPSLILSNIVTVSVDGTGGFFGHSSVMPLGNGVFIRDGGYVLTSAYVMESDGDITVTTADGAEYKASLVGTDSDMYISILKIDKPDASAVPVGDSDSVNVGDKIVGAGNRISNQFDNPLTFGYVCGYNSDVEMTDGTLAKFFQTDASVLVGSVGGMMFNYSGELLGMCTAKYASMSSNIALVTPVNDLVGAANAIIDNIPQEKTGQLGITAADEDYGVSVENVFQDSPADKAGLQKGDLIMKLNGNTVRKLSEIAKIKRSLAAGDEMVFTVYRNGETVDITVVLE